MPERLVGSGVDAWSVDLACVAGAETLDAPTKPKSARSTCSVKAAAPFVFEINRPGVPFLPIL